MNGAVVPHDTAVRESSGCRAAIDFDDAWLDRKASQLELGAYERHVRCEPRA